MTILRSRLLLAFVSLTFASGCSTNNWMRPAECALIGAGLGTVAGLGWAANENNADFEDWAGGIGVGLAGGALVGYGFCYIMSRGGYSTAAARGTIEVAGADEENDAQPRVLDERYGLAALSEPVSR